MRSRILAILATVLTASATLAEAQSLRGSAASLTRQNRQAKLHNYSYLQHPSDVQRFVRAGLLVSLRDNPEFDLARVSYPYARPEVKIFLERLGRQYHAACGERLVVTSSVRPASRQPRNASSRSVHPTGMAVDLRRSTNRKCSKWLEDVLLHLERRGVAEATLEQRPPHYHVALFPKPYIRYIGGAAVSDATRVASAEAPERSEARLTASEVETYEVRRGDSLWSIARKFGTTVEALKAENGLRSSRVLAGQTLRIPSER